jgi:hypothetical protein
VIPLYRYATIKESPFEVTVCLKSILTTMKFSVFYAENQNTVLNSNLVFCVLKERDLLGK